MHVDFFWHIDLENSRPFESRGCPNGILYVSRTKRGDFQGVLAMNPLEFNNTQNILKFYKDISVFQNM